MITVALAVILVVCRYFLVVCRYFLPSPRDMDHFLPRYTLVHSAVSRFIPNTLGDLDFAVSG